MGPTKECLDLARFLIATFKLTVDEIELGYAIQGWMETQETELAKEST